MNNINDFSYCNLITRQISAEKTKLQKKTEKTLDPDFKIIDSFFSSEIPNGPNASGIVNLQTSKSVNKIFFKPDFFSSEIAKALSKQKNENE